MDKIHLPFLESGRLMVFVTADVAQFSKIWALDQALVATKHQVGDGRK